MRAVRAAVSLILVLATVPMFASHIPGASEPISYDGSLAAGVGVTGAIGWATTPVDGYDWYCFDVASGTAVTITATRATGDIIPDLGLVQDVFAEGTAVGGAVTLVATENDTQTTVTLSFMPDFSGPVTLWVSTWLNEAGGTYNLTMTGGLPRGSCAPGSAAGPPPPNVTLGASDVTIANDSSGNVMISSSVLPTFDSLLSLKAEGQPLGVTVTFAPSTIAAPGSGTSVMTINVGPDVLPSTYIIDVRAFDKDGSSYVTSIQLKVPCDPPFVLDNATAQPKSVTVPGGGRATLSIKVERGTAPLRFQWYMGPRGSTAFPIRGVNSREMTTPAINAATDFWVRVSNPCGTADSWTATVTPSGGGKGQKPVYRSRRGQ